MRVHEMFLRLHRLHVAHHHLALRPVHWTEVPGWLEILHLTWWEVFTSLLLLDVLHLLLLPVHT